MTSVPHNSRTEQLGEQMYALAAELYPLCRSMTGDGVRRTLLRLAKFLPLQMHEVPSGTKIFDWEVPREWNIRDAFIQDESGQRVVDFRQSNLHVVGYSVPVRATMSWSELKPHLHTLPDHPNWIPYRNSFGRESWGFCLTHRQYRQLEAQGERTYEVCIDSSLQPGALTYGEVFLPGGTDDEVLISTHICHPSLANDNLSGIAVATFLAKELLTRERRYSYRILFIPATIGAITWLSLNQRRTVNVKHGWVITGVGDPGTPTYKRSRRGNAEIDRAFACVLEHSEQTSTLLDFEPFGYDERQFCSPGFNLPMGCLMRTPHQRYPEYHTSADNLQFIRPQSLANTWSVCCSVVELLEANRCYFSQSPYGEPRLGPRGLYQAVGTGVAAGDLQKALLWVLNFSDGAHSLLDIAERSDLPFQLIRQAAELLRDQDLLAPTDASSSLPAYAHESITPVEHVLN